MEIKTHYSCSYLYGHTLHHTHTYTKFPYMCSILVLFWFVSFYEQICSCDVFLIFSRIHTHWQKQAYNVWPMRDFNRPYNATKDDMCLLYTGAWSCRFPRCSTMAAQCTYRIGKIQRTYLFFDVSVEKWSLDVRQKCMIIRLLIHSAVLFVLYLSKIVKNSKLQVERSEQLLDKQEQVKGWNRLAVTLSISVCGLLWPIASCVRTCCSITQLIVEVSTWARPQ